MDTLQTILNASMREALSPQTAAVVIAVIGLNVHFGFTGLLNMGQSGFMLLGAYGFAIPIIHGWPMLAAVVTGLVLALVFALLLGVPTLKLRGDYLAIVTISAAEIIRYVGRSSILTDLTGAAQGLKGAEYRGPFTSLSFFGEGGFTLLPFNYQDVAGGATWFWTLMFVVLLAVVAALVYVAVRGRERGVPHRTLVIAGLSVVVVLLLLFLAPVSAAGTGVNGWWFRAVAWVFILVCSGIVFLLARSPWGRLLRGIREDEDAMRSLGKNVFMVKMQALVIGGMFGAIGGMLYVLPSSVQPDSMGRTLTFFCWTALLLGGSATIFGPVLGTVLFFTARVFIQTAANQWVPNNWMNDQQAQQFSFIVVGIVLMLLVIFRPQGLLGDKRELRFNV